MKIITLYKLISILSCLIFSSTFAQKIIHDTVYIYIKEKKKDENKRSIIRVGAGASGGLCIIFPKEANQFADDFFKNLWSQYFSSTDPGVVENIPSFQFGYDYQLKLNLRLLDLFQVEGYIEKFYGSGLYIKYHFYEYYYSNYSQNHDEIDAEYRFTPSYNSYGLNLLLTPGAKSKKAFFKIGTGINFLNGKLNYNSEGKFISNNTTTNIYENIDYISTKITTGYYLFFGSVYPIAKFIEFDATLTYRLAKIPEVRTATGQPFTNIYRNNVIIPIDFTGIDIRAGINIMIP